MKGGRDESREVDNQRDRRRDVVMRGECVEKMDSPNDGAVGRQNQR